MTWARSLFALVMWIWANTMAKGSDGIRSNQTCAQRGLREVTIVGQQGVFCVDVTPCGLASPDHCPGAGAMDVTGKIMLRASSCCALLPNSRALGCVLPTDHLLCTRTTKPSSTLVPTPRPHPTTLLAGRSSAPSHRPKKTPSSNYTAAPTASPRSTLRPFAHAPVMSPTDSVVLPSMEPIGSEFNGSLQTNDTGLNSDTYEGPTSAAGSTWWDLTPWTEAQPELGTDADSAKPGDTNHAFPKPNAEPKPTSLDLKPIYDNDGASPSIGEGKDSAGSKRRRPGENPTNKSQATPRMAMSGDSMMLLAVGSALLLAVVGGLVLFRKKSSKKRGMSPLSLPLVEMPSTPKSPSSQYQLLEECVIVPMMSPPTPVSQSQSQSQSLMQSPSLRSQRTTQEYDWPPNEFFGSSASPHTSPQSSTKLTPQHDFLLL